MNSPITRLIRGVRASFESRISSIACSRLGTDVGNVRLFLNSLTKALYSFGLRNGMDFFIFLIPFIMLSWQVFKWSINRSTVWYLFKSLISLRNVLAITTKVSSNSFRSAIKLLMICGTALLSARSKCLRLTGRCKNSDTLQKTGDPNNQLEFHWDKFPLLIIVFWPVSPRQ